MLWKNIERIHTNQVGLWCVIGDFNNVTTSQDRIGGKLVQENEYVDLINMMKHTGLAEMDSQGDYYTWSNKQSVGTIHSRIDRAICNIDWFLKYSTHILCNLPPNISDHSMLHISGTVGIRKWNHFKFNNYLLDVNGFQDMVNRSWTNPARGNPMQILWYKLQRLKTDIKNFSKQHDNIKQKLVEARENLHKAQTDFMSNRQDSSILSQIQQYTEDIIRLHEHEHHRIKKRLKLDWIRQGDDNSRFFFASLKAKQNKNTIKFLQKDDGDLITDQHSIETEIMHFYKGLMGDKQNIIKQIDVEAMRGGNQVPFEQQEYLVSKVTSKEIEEALKDIGDCKSPGIDGYSSKNFKNCWQIMKQDIIAVVDIFSKQGRFTRGSIKL